MTRENATVADYASATARAFDMDPGELTDILQKLREASRPHYGTATNELRSRLNARLRGEDPGPPMHWRGLPVRRW